MSAIAAAIANLLQDKDPSQFVSWWPLLCYTLQWLTSTPLYLTSPSSVFFLLCLLPNRYQQATFYSFYYHFLLCNNPTSIFCCLITPMIFLICVYFLISINFLFISYPNRDSLFTFVHFCFQVIFLSFVFCT